MEELELMLAKVLKKFEDQREKAQERIETANAVIAQEQAVIVAQEQEIEDADENIMLFQSLFDAITKKAARDSEAAASLFTKRERTDADLIEFFGATGIKLADEFQQAASQEGSQEGAAGAAT